MYVQWRWRRSEITLKTPSSRLSATNLHARLLVGCAVIGFGKESRRVASKCGGSESQIAQDGNNVQATLQGWWLRRRVPDNESKGFFANVSVSLLCKRVKLVISPCWTDAIVMDAKHQTRCKFAEKVHRQRGGP